MTLAALVGRQITVVGYGNQGRAHALNLRDSGLSVIIGQRPGAGYEQACQDGFVPVTIGEAARAGDVVILSLPDEAVGAVYADHVAPCLQSGQVIGFVHGFAIHYRQIQPASHLDVILVAPKGAGYMVRDAYTRGSGLPCLVGVHQDASGGAWGTARSWAAAIGARRAGIIESSFAEETETDLFGEQAAVVGGVTAVMKAAFETLVEAGYAPENAYLECVHEVKFVVDLIHAHGLTGMRERISDTAEYGDLSRHERLMAALKPEMRTILRDIRSGTFATEWLTENGTGRADFTAALIRDANSELESTGQRLRELFAGSNLSSNQPTD